MGCSSSIAPHQQQDSDHVGVQILDAKQRRILQETWRLLLPERVNIGKQVFLRVFETEPRIKTVFELESEWGDNLLTNSDFQKQSTRFIDTVGYMVENVEYFQSKCGPYMLHVGDFHAHRSGFLAQYFGDFEKAR